MRIALDDQDSFERAKELVSEWNEDGTRTPLNARLLKTGIESVLGEGYTYVRLAHCICPTVSCEIVRYTDTCCTNHRAALTAATVSGRTEATDAGPKRLMLVPHNTTRKP